MLLTPCCSQLGLLRDVMGLYTEEVRRGVFVPITWLKFCIVIYRLEMSKYTIWGVNQSVFQQNKEESCLLHKINHHKMNRCIHPQAFAFTLRAFHYRKPKTGFTSKCLALIAVYIRLIDWKLIKAYLMNLYFKSLMKFCEKFCL